MFFTWNAAIKTRYNCSNINIFFQHSLYCVSLRALMCLRPGVTFSPGFSNDYNVHESFATFGEIQDSEEEERKRERTRKKTRYPDQPVHEK